ncbi:hypothetical protein ANMWB30_42800 [Arthrobacter sp. MWB30]|nr:hypothetical protein ANMWB30_42800 [Arthrobacter sp. MWB30]
MNKERDDEIKAKQIVERGIGIQFEHTDTGGGVDYMSTDRTVALEVTSVTDGEKQGARDALAKSVAKGSPTILQGCWIVFTSENQPGMKYFAQRVEPAIAELEFAGKTDFNEYFAQAHVLEKGELSSIYQSLLMVGVKRASHVPHPGGHPDGPDHVHRIYPLTGSGGSVSGSDESLELLIGELMKKSDNPKKLLDSGAEQRHLFVWLNDDTWFNIARPLGHDAPSWADDGWGLPTKDPKMAPAITHLWVMHDRTRRGWLWDGQKWQEL